MKTMRKPQMGFFSYCILESGVLFSTRSALCGHQWVMTIFDTPATPVPQTDSYLRPRFIPDRPFAAPGIFDNRIIDIGRRGLTTIVSVPASRPR
jgi:hypothetical protein